MDNETRDYWDGLMARALAARRERLLSRGMPRSEGVHDEEELGNPQQESQEKTPLKWYRIDEVTPESSFKRKAAKALEGVKKVFGKISKIFKRKKPTEEPQRGRSRTRKPRRGQP